MNTVTVVSVGDTPTAVIANIANIANKTNTANTGQHPGPLRIVRQCRELAELLALCQTGLAQAAVIASAADELTATLVDRLTAVGVCVVAVAVTAEETRRLRGIGVTVVTGEVTIEALSQAVRAAVEGRKHHSSTGYAVPAFDPNPPAVPVDVLEQTDDAGIPALEVVGTDSSRKLGDEVLHRGLWSRITSAGRAHGKSPLRGSNDVHQPGRPSVSNQPGLADQEASERRNESALDRDSDGDSATGRKDESEDRGDSRSRLIPQPENLAPDAGSDASPLLSSTSGSSSQGEAEQGAPAHGASAPRRADERKAADRKENERRTKKREFGGRKVLAKNALGNSTSRQPFVGHKKATRLHGAEDAGSSAVIAVWGPIGSPGRTTVAINLAAEQAAAGRTVLLIDADSYGASVAAALGLLDESASFAQACRAADQGALTQSHLAQTATQVVFQGGTFSLLTGLTRADRWPELRAAAVERVLSMARNMAQLVVVDCGFALENDEELSYDTIAPRRNAATLAVLAEANIVIAVGNADLIGIPRLIRGLTELRATFPLAEVRVVINKVRRKAVGRSPEKALEQAWERFGPNEKITHFLPWDPELTDKALLEGRLLMELSPEASLRRAIRDISCAVDQRKSKNAVSKSTAKPEVRG